MLERRNLFREHVLRTEKLLIVPCILILLPSTTTDATTPTALTVATATFKCIWQPCILKCELAALLSYSWGDG